MRVERSSDPLHLVDILEVTSSRLNQVALKLSNNTKRIQHHLLEIDAAAAVRVVQPERPGQLLIVGSLPADAHRQQPLPDNVRLSLGQK